MAIPLNELMKEIDGLLGEANEELEDLINKSSTIDLTLPDFEKASCKKV